MPLDLKMKERKKKKKEKKNQVFQLQIIKTSKPHLPSSPRTSTVVQVIFYIWSFEFSVNILKT